MGQTKLAGVISLISRERKLRVTRTAQPVSALLIGRRFERMPSRAAFYPRLHIEVVQTKSVCYSHTQVRYSCPRVLLLRRLGLISTQKTNIYPYQARQTTTSSPKKTQSLTQPTHQANAHPGISPPTPPHPDRERTMVFQRTQRGIQI